MDAVKFLVEVGRMCGQYPDCRECPLYLKKYHVGGRKTVEECREMVAIVEKWSKEHPVVTNGMKVLEMIPAVERSVNNKGYIEICIRKSWWDAEYKEGEK